MSMHGKAMATVAAVVAKLPSAGCRRLLDVGGGPGTYSVMPSESLPGIAGHRLGFASGYPHRLRLDRAAGSLRPRFHPAWRLSRHTFPRRQRCGAVLRHDAPGIRRRHSVSAAQSLRCHDARRVRLRHGYDDRSLAHRAQVLCPIRREHGPHHRVRLGSSLPPNWKAGTKAADFCHFEVHPLPPPIPHWLASARKPRQT